MPTSIESYLARFQRLKRSWGPAWRETTLRRAPHKPFLLLAVIDLIEDGGLVENRIVLTPELSETFTSYWRCLSEPAPPDTIFHPLSRLRTEGFWRLVPQPGRADELNAAEEIKSLRQFHRLVQHACLDDDLFDLLAGSPVARERLRSALIESCFDANTQGSVWEQTRSNRAIHTYSIQILRAPSVRDQPVTPVEYVRDQAFRRAVLKAYDRRCGLCGIRIVTVDGQTAVEAAHIKPWHVSHDDRPANGMALCRLCHWAFDSGLMTVNDSYRVLTSVQLAAAGNIAAHIGTLKDREMVRPSEPAHWPDRESLLWHHRHRFCDG